VRIAQELSGRGSEWTIEERVDLRSRSKKRLRDVQRDIANLTDAIASVGLSDALRDRLAAAENELKKLQQTLASIETAKSTVDAIHGGIQANGD
jgi:chromosome segregation ATPase